MRPAAVPAAIAALGIIATASRSASAASSTATGGFKLPPSVQRTFKNGVRAFVVEYHELPLLEIEVILRTGAAHDPAGKAGLASLTSGLLRKGAGSRTATELAEAVDFVGGSLGASADYEGTRVAGEFLAKDADLALELVTDLLRRPTFAAEEVERLKGEVIGELQAARENPSLTASRRFTAVLYKGHPYGQPPVGLERSVASLTPEDVRGFYRAHYAPAGAIVVAVGHFKSAEMLDKLEARLVDWSAPEPARRATGDPEPPPGRSTYLVDKADATQSQIRIGGIGIRRTDPDYVALQVANTILGAGFTSRLVEEIRVNRGLSYGVGSRLFTMMQPGPFLISTFTKNATTRETIDVALEVMDRFRREGPTEAEVDKARRYLRGLFAIDHQSPEAVAEALAEIAFYDLPRDYYDTYLDKIAAVTAADVKRVSARLPWEKLVILVLGKAAEVGKSLESLGPVTALPLEEP